LRNGGASCPAREPRIFRGALLRHEDVVNLIGNIRTATGLSIQAELDTAQYPKRVKVSDEELRKLNLTRDTFHGEWNYSIAPHCSG
jgi:hypothetical protein